jgi:hypothetical protein
MDPTPFIMLLDKKKQIAPELPKILKRKVVGRIAL